MKDFYKQVRVDEKGDYFFAACPVCGKRQYGIRVPLLCRTLHAIDLSERGMTLGYHVFNKAHVTAVHNLATAFNFCRKCGAWVCDECFIYDKADGICKKCEAKLEKREFKEES